MKTNIYIPKKIKVGYNERKDTYTQKLAYVIYYDHKDVLRKEKSWESWRSKTIDPSDYDNVPMSGFVLNKKVGGVGYSSWNPRATYVRVYDPRGFEVEISIPNLLYILENGNSIKGKGLEGDFIYAWDGTELVLMPIASPEYAEITVFNDIVQTNSHIKAKDLVIGATYMNKKNEELLYMGRYDRYDRSEGKSLGKHHWFRYSYRSPWSEGVYVRYDVKRSIGEGIISCVDSQCSPLYSEYFEEMSCNREFSPYDPSKDEVIPHTIASFESHMKKSNYIMSDSLASIQFYVNYETKKWYVAEQGFWGRSHTIEMDVSELFEKYHPVYVNKYLANGKFYTKEY